MTTFRMDISQRRELKSKKLAMDIMSVALRGGTSRWDVFGGDRELAVCLAKKHGGGAQCAELTTALTNEIACALLGGRLLVKRTENGQSHYALPK